ncbi:DUF4129 domain-containing protein [Mycobacterium sp. 4D054]|uniref:DUF4129 domain-containing protein n=1 Tax=Mycobacterium sp. 4D054 TaxID=3457440 RepID=UPI003FD60C74
MPEKTEPAAHDKAARTITVIVLTLLAITALRGYLPDAGGDPPPDQPAEAGPGSLIAVIAMLVVSVAVITIAVFAQASQRAAAPPPGEPPRTARERGVPIRWRTLLIIGAALTAWTLLVLLLMRWVPAVVLDEQTVPDTRADAASSAETTPDAEPPAGPYDGAVFAALLGTTVALFALAIVAALTGRRHAPAPAVPTEPAAPGPAAPAPDLARAAELGLAEMGDLSRDPRQAIIACYLAMERELEKSPGTTPRDSDTPTEVLARAIRSGAVDAGSATELVELFEEARFSPHLMNEGHRVDAVHALRQVQRQLQAAT